MTASDEKQADAILVCALVDALRATLHRLDDAIPPQCQAAALTYTLAALVAKNATSEAQACALLDAWIADMKLQIQLLGVGVEHP